MDSGTQKLRDQETQGFRGSETLRLRYSKRQIHRHSMNQGLTRYQTGIAAFLDMRKE